MTTERPYKDLFTSEIQMKIDAINIATDNQNIPMPPKQSRRYEDLKQELKLRNAKV